MTAATVMSALGQVLPAGTRVQTVVQESVLELLNGASNWPAIVIYCDATEETYAAAHMKQEIHTISVAFFDPWDSSTRTVAQLAADARTTLEQMKANLRANKTLKISGVPWALEADHHIHTLPLGIADKIEVGGKTYALPMSMYTAILVLEELRDLWFREL
jgi:hypothetical protein